MTASHRSGALLAVVVVATARLLFVAPGAAPDVTLPWLVMALGPFLTLVVFEYRAPTLGASVVLGTAAGLYVVAVVRPNIGSHDLWSYAMYGRILAFHHANPYRHVPAAYPRDAALLRVGEGWRHTLSVYGPGFTVLSAVVAKVAGASALATRVAFQATTALCVAACGILLWRSHVRVAAILAFALNPLTVVVVINNAHNDALIGLALLAAALAARDERWLRMGLLLAAAASVKVVTLIAVAACVPWVWRHVGWRAAARVLTAAVVPVVAAYAMFGGRVALEPLTSSASHLSRATLWRFVSVLSRAVVGRSVHGIDGPMVFAGIAIVLVALVAVRVDQPNPTAVLLAGLAAYLFAAGWILPWYLAWALPLVALDASARLSRVVALYAITMLFAYQYQNVALADRLDAVLHDVVIGSQAFTFCVSMGCIAVAVMMLFRRRPRLARLEASP